MHLAAKPVKCEPCVSQRRVPFEEEWEDAIGTSSGRSAEIQVDDVCL